MPRKLILLRYMDNLYILEICAYSLKICVLNSTDMHKSWNSTTKIACVGLQPCNHSMYFFLHIVPSPRSGFVAPVVCYVGSVVHGHG